MKLFDLPEPLQQVILLATDRGQWIRVGTFTLGVVMIGVGFFLLVRRPLTAVAASAVGDVMKGVTK